MSNSECAHKIVIENLENGEIINYSLLLIKGQTQHLRTKCEEQKLELLGRLQPVGGVKNKSEACRDECAWQQHTKLSRNGEFKLLCDLREHEALIRSKGDKFVLQLEFRHCTASTLFELQYKSRGNTKNSYSIQPLLIVGCDENPTSEYLIKNCAKINLNLRLVQCIYAEQLNAAGFGRCSFTLNNDCQVFASHQTCQQIWQQTEDSLWQNFASEILNSPVWGGQTSIKFVAFISCTRYEADQVVATGDFSYANIRRHMKGHAALGGGGLALFGTAYMWAWPQMCKDIIDYFSDTTQVDLTRFPDDSNYRRTHGGVYATTLGALVHEIGHSFDLGHTREGIMGKGFDYVNRFFTLDNLTESLPDRIIERQPADASLTQPTPRPRFTQLKRSANSFLEKYHEQKISDPFYFTRNCLIILSKHKWFAAVTQSGVAEKYKVDAEKLITYDAINGYVKSTQDNHPLCLIEVRCEENSLVKYWYEFKLDEDQRGIYKFNLPKEAEEALRGKHYLFVLTQTGLIRRL